MKYIITALLLMAFTGCGSNDTKKKEPTIASEHQQEVVKESAPQNVERDKTPPAIPQI